jgi:excisionase family DNA binding protein
MPDNQKVTLTLKEAAEILSVHSDTVRLMVNKGTLPAIKIHNGPRKQLIRIRRASLDKFMHDHETRGTK